MNLGEKIERIVKQEREQQKEVEDEINRCLKRMIELVQTQNIIELVVNTNQGQLSLRKDSRTQTFTVAFHPRVEGILLRGQVYARGNAEDVVIHFINNLKGSTYQNKLVKILSNEKAIVKAYWERETMTFEV